ncbi:pyruvate dehydrogenase (acetyl-transferring) E1 component subunit alpha [Virgibacillus dakarensis]|uniref:Acetoin:2,6-dichlorophenolindophenol oxidoreductase subunit alpha n=1 Tax=Lentibacillus populi TaxID=1827502 RepID=A0A9W5TWP1_9BACI|nr:MULTISPECIES: thiamine pyrophosphate-dependent dehydrogenase E1 component subunit alpha [Bacillaceae]MBT2217282.1 thiamine pyrophosphate-dependent dehydrogenase E1 component subunit alpha [Virgibacillus dakarensis]MTW86783.1 pyruvate dehydrogenase (acetyl-transferring) E1 component subunit alpha [Virgibacillus dakarensis]GGB38320.1 acetoin:2,6-dichlorophenolindophenol oxidoreductase subunit alpha [Lentibacillus populi]
MDKQKAYWIYTKMNEIRNFEEKVRKIFSTGSIPGFVHLYAGEEAIAVGVCAHLSDNDYITSTHRGHGHCIAKGCDLNGMMAEIFGKETGLCNGKGGSMHIADLGVGMLGANGIVGGGFPLAAGAGLTAYVRETGGVAVCFFGDGANNHGTFHEGINIAAALKLPVIFVAENNGFGEATPFEYATSAKTIADRAASYDIPGIRVDGSNLVDVYQAAEEAVERARNGEGPTLIEAITYRTYGHFEGDNQAYKSESDSENWPVEVDCIDKFEQYALKKSLLTKTDISEIKDNAHKAVEAAVAFAENSNEPSPDTLTENVYVQYK